MDALIFIWECPLCSSICSLKASKTILTCFTKKVFPDPHDASSAIEPPKLNEFNNVIKLRIEELRSIESCSRQSNIFSGVGDSSNECTDIASYSS